MNLSPKYIAAIILAVFAILGWNAFLIVRDDKLFKAYYHQKALIEQQSNINSAYQSDKQH